MPPLIRNFVPGLELTPVHDDDHAQVGIETNSAWMNWADLDYQREHDELSIYISVNDPRGSDITVSLYQKDGRLAMKVTSKVDHKERRQKVTEIEL